jgi:putative glutamine amidotransferase
VLGLCLGSQTMNVAAGGTMIQDIPSEIYGCKTAEDVLKFPRDRIHSSRYVSAVYPAEFDLAYAFHRIRILPDSFFTRVLKMKTSDTPYVLSSHHQGIEKLGKDITVIARSMDGKIVEAITHNKYPNVLGVQFHPENNNLFKEDKLYREGPGKPKNFNPLTFLKRNAPSYRFHQKIWKWFSDAVQNNTKK